MRRALFGLIVVACGPTPRSPRASASVGCADALRARDAIDTSPAPAICAPLFEALAPLGPEARARIHGLAIVRHGRGRCGDACPDLATALMSDATLAYYDAGAHALVVDDATFAGPAWRGGTPDAAALAAYLAGLGLDWPGLVARLGLPQTAPIAVGAPEVFDTIVRRGPRALLGGDVPLVDLLRHELGHAIELHRPDRSSVIAGWSSATGWREVSSGEIADGYVDGAFASEQPIVASRLVLGLARGAGFYAPGGATPTAYGAFDPIEDFAEAFRLVHADPVALGTASPVRLVIAAAGEVSLRDPALRRFIGPGVTALLAPEVDPAFAMAILRAHGDALLPEAAALADPRPLPIPAELDPDVRAQVDRDALVVTIGAYRFRPSDAAIRAYIANLTAAVRDLRGFDR
jgi:hypothetical protein